MSHDYTTEQDDEAAHKRITHAAVAPRHDSGAEQEADSALFSGHTRQRRGQSLHPAIVQGMQQTHGNRAVRRFLQRASSSPANVTDDQLASRIEKRAGRGRALESNVQRKLETGLGADLSGVRVHTDSEADQMARSVDSVAFATGQDIFFREGAYNPSSQAGLHLLAHEATHTVQQAQGPVAGTPGGGGISISDPSDEHERAASASANRIASGKPGAHTSGSSGGASGAGMAHVQRETKAEEEEESAKAKPSQADEKEAANQPAIHQLNPSDYDIKPITEGIYSGGQHLVDRNMHDEWLFKPDGGALAEQLTMQGKNAPGGRAQERPPGFRLEVVELNGQTGTLVDWTRKDDTLADIMNRDPQLYSELMSSPLKSDIDLVSVLVASLDKRPDNLRVKLNPNNKQISKLEPIDVDAAIPPGTLRDAVLPFLKKGGSGPAEATAEMVNSLQRLVTNKESLRRVMEVFYDEDTARRILLGLESTMAAAVEASKKTRK